MIHPSVVGCLLFWALCLSPQGQLLAIQSSSSIVLVETAAWRLSSSDSALNGDSDGHNRLAWALGGAALGAGIAVLGSAVASVSSESSDDGKVLRAAVIGAALGATAGLIISGPAPEKSAESSVLLVASSQWQWLVADET